MPNANFSNTNDLLRYIRQHAQDIISQPSLTTTDLSYFVNHIHRGIRNTTTIPPDTSGSMTRTTTTTGERWYVHGDFHADMYPGLWNEPNRTPIQLTFWPEITGEWLYHQYFSGAITKSEYERLNNAYTEGQTVKMYKDVHSKEPDKALEALREAAGGVYEALIATLPEGLLEGYMPLNREEVADFMRKGNLELGVSRTFRMLWSGEAQRLMYNEKLDWDEKVAIGVLKHYARTWYRPFQHPLSL